MWGRLDEFQRKLTSGIACCERVAMNEQVMGYQESSDTYNLMASEINDARQWLIDEEIRWFSAGKH